MNPELAERDEKITNDVGEFAIEQAVRRDHCARKHLPRHTCVGALSILPDRCVLSCKVCGVERVNVRHVDDVDRSDATLKLAQGALYGGEKHRGTP